MSPLLDENNRDFLLILGEVAKSKESANIWRLESCIPRVWQYVHVVQTKPTPAYVSFFPLASLYCSLALKILCSQLGEDSNVRRFGGVSELSNAMESYLNSSTSQRSSGTSTHIMLQICQSCSW